MKKVVKKGKQVEGHKKRVEEKGKQVEEDSAEVRRTGKVLEVELRCLKVEGLCVGAGGLRKGGEVQWLDECH